MGKILLCFTDLLDSPFPLDACVSGRQSLGFIHCRWFPRHHSQRRRPLVHGSAHAPTAPVPCVAEHLPCLVPHMLSVQSDAYGACLVATGEVRLFSSSVIVGRCLHVGATRLCQYRRSTPRLYTRQSRGCVGSKELLWCPLVTAAATRTLSKWYWFLRIMRCG